MDSIERNLSRIRTELLRRSKMDFKGSVVIIAHAGLLPADPGPLLQFLPLAEVVPNTRSEPPGGAIRRAFQRFLEFVR